MRPDRGTVSPHRIPTFAWVLGVIGVALCAILTVLSCGLLAVMADDSMRPDGFWYGVGVSAGILGTLLFPCLALGVSYLVVEVVERTPRA